MACCAWSIDSRWSNIKKLPTIVANYHPLDLLVYAVRSERLETTQCIAPASPRMNQQHPEYVKLSIQFYLQSDPLSVDYKLDIAMRGQTYNCTSHLYLCMRSSHCDAMQRLPSRSLKALHGLVRQNAQSEAHHDFRAISITERFALTVTLPRLPIGPALIISAQQL